MQIVSKLDSRRLNAAKVLSWAILIVSAVGFLAWNMELDYQCDDLWYKLYFAGNDKSLGLDPLADSILYSQPEITTWEQVFGSIYHHYLSWTNGRLANALMYVSIMFPKVFSDVAHALMLLMMMWGLARLSSGRRWMEHPLRLGVITLFVWLGWPWADMKGSSDYFFNYVWSTALVLYFVILFQQLNRESSLGRIVWTSVVGFIAAMMHEGISVPFMAGIGGYIVLGWFYGGRLAEVERPSRGHVISACCFLVGILCITVFCPALMDRLKWYQGDVSFYWKSALVFYVCRFYFLTFGILLIPFVIKKMGLSLFCSRTVVNSLFLITCVGGFVLAISESLYARSAWALYVVCTILLTKGIASLGLFKNRGNLSMVPATVCCLLTVGFFVDLLLTQAKRTSLRQRLTNEIRRSPMQGIYYVNLDNEISDPWWINHLAMRVPSLDIDSEEELLFRFNHAAYAMYGVLPAKYCGLPIDSLPLMPGDSGLRGVYPYYFTTNMNHKAAHEQWWHASEFYTAFEFPEGTSPFVKYTPASIGRLLWDPKWDYNKVECLYPCYRYRLPVTQGMREHNFVGEDVDSIIMYIMHRGKPTMTGMRPVRMGIEIPDDVKRRNGIK